MKITFGLILWILFCTFACAKEPYGKSGFNMTAFRVSPEVPGSISVAHTPYNQPQALDVRDNLDKKIREREVNYSWFWIKKVMKPEFLYGTKIADAQAVADIGPRKDDGVVLTWDSKGYEFEIIDSRVLTLLIQRKGLGGIDVAEVFKTLTDYAYHTNKDVIQVTSRQAGQLTESESYGEILVDRGNARGWFKDPIGWYKKDDILLFVFNKFLKLPASKIPIRDATRVIGGIGWDDERSFLRFEKSNRVQLAEEYSKKINKASKADPSVNKETKGVPLYK